MLNRNTDGMANEVVEMDNDAWTREDEHRLEELQNNYTTNTSTPLSSEEEIEMSDLIAKREIFYEAGMTVLRGAKSDHDDKSMLGSRKKKIQYCFVASVIILLTTGSAVLLVLYL